MGLKLARVLEGVKESDYANSAPFIKAVEAMAKKLAGNWIPDFDRMSGSLSWGKKGSKWSFYATPNWDGADNTPVNVQFDSDDVEGHGGHKIAFSLDVKKSPEENAANYIAHVVVPTINDIERGKYGKKESKLRLGAVLEGMDVSSIKKAVDSGKKVHWTNSSYTVVKDSKGQYMITHPGGSAIGLTHADGKTLNGEPKEFFVSESKLRLGAVLGEVKDLSWLGKDNRLKPLTKREGDGKGKSAVRGLRAAIKSAEEDMTPGIGDRMGRKDLGAYGKRKGSAPKSEGKRHAALEDAIKQASDMLKPRRDAKGRLILVGEEAGFSGKLAADFADLISDVEDVKRKPWMKAALISHLSTSYKHPRKDAEDFVNAYFSGTEEAGLANFGGKKAKPFEKEEGQENK